MYTRAVSLTLVCAFLLAGCSGLGGGSVDSTPSPLVRIIRVTIDQQTMETSDAFDTPQEGFASIATVQFDYTHDGSSVDASEATATYRTTSGEDATVPLSSFTEEATIESGSIVRIEPGTAGTPRADILTPMTVRAGDDVLFAREGVERTWMTAQGVPIPLAFTEDGTAKWDLKASADFGADLSGLSMDMEGESVAFDTLTFGLDLQMDGTFEAATSAAADGPLLSLNGNLHGAQTMEFEMDGGSDGQTMKGSADASFDVDVPRAGVDLQFGPDGDLQSVTAQGEITIEGSMQGTGDFAEVPEMPSPLLHEEFGPETETIPAAVEAVDERVIEFLSALWGLDLATGDEVRVQVDFESEDFMPEVHATFVSQVLGTEDRQVGSQSRLAFKLSDTFDINVGVSAKSWQFGYEQTYWVDAESYLPLYMQGTVERTFNRADMQEVIETARTFAGDEMPNVELPADASFTIRTETTLELSSDSTDLATAAVFGGGGARTSMVVAAAVVFVLVTKLSGEESSHAPSLSIVRDEASDRLTIVSADSGLDYSQFKISNDGGNLPGTTGLRFLLNGKPAAATGTSNPEGAQTTLGSASKPIVAGNFIGLCATGAAATNVVVKLMHTETNTQVFESTFATIARCA